MKIVAILITAILFCHSSRSQDHFYDAFKSKKKLAYNYYQKNKYAEAAEYLWPLYNKNKLDNEYLSMLADCLFKTDRKTDALYIYKFMEQENLEFDQNSRNQYFICMVQGDSFEKAYQWYFQKDTLSNDIIVSNKIAKKIEKININSDYDDYCPAPYQFGFLYLSTKPNYSPIATLPDNSPQPYYALMAEDGSLTEQQKFSFNLWPNATYAGFTLLERGQKLIISANVISNRAEGNFFTLYYCEKKENKWQLIQKLDLGNANIMHPYYHSNEDKLYFSADLNGSGTDIFYCELKNGLDNLSPVRLGSNINTPGNEIYPTIYQDSLLVFASDGHYGLGGLDLYEVSIKQKSQKVKNLGEPFNSKWDDFALVFYPFSQFGFFSSDRESMGSNIYKFYIKSN